MKGRVCVCVRSLLCERAALHVRMEKMGAVYGTAESSEREREREGELYFTTFLFSDSLRTLLLLLSLSSVSLSSIIIF